MRPLAGFTLTPAAACTAASLLVRAKSCRQSSNARLAVRLLDQSISGQAHRVITHHVPDLTTLTTISSDDIPGHIDLCEPIADLERPGQYL
jgi:AAA lid domain-containing protein